MPGGYGAVGGSGGAPTGGGVLGGLGSFFQDPGSAGMLAQLGMAFAPQNQFVQGLGQSTIALAKAQSAKKLLDDETKKAQMKQDDLLKQALQGAQPADNVGATSMTQLQTQGTPKTLGSAFSQDAGTMPMVGSSQPSAQNFR